jgi:hypothetical protein
MSAILTIEMLMKLLMRLLLLLLLLRQTIKHKWLRNRDMPLMMLAQGRFIVDHILAVVVDILTVVAGVCWRRTRRVRMVAVHVDIDIGAVTVTTGIKAGIIARCHDNRCDGYGLSSGDGWQSVGEKSGDSRREEKSRRT